MATAVASAAAVSTAATGASGGSGPTVVPILGFVWIARVRTALPPSTNPRAKAAASSGVNPDEAEAVVCTDTASSARACEVPAE